MQSFLPFAPSIQPLSLALLDEVFGTAGCGRSASSKRGRRHAVQKLCKLKLGTSNPRIPNPECSPVTPMTYFFMVYACLIHGKNYH